MNSNRNHTTARKFAKMLADAERQADNYYAAAEAIEALPQNQGDCALGDEVRRLMTMCDEMTNEVDRLREAAIAAGYTDDDIANAAEAVFG